MTTQEIVIYLNTLIDTDVSLTTDKRIVLKAAVVKLETPISLEERTQIIILLITVLLEWTKK